jgi:hypothetical protein
MLATFPEYHIVPFRRVGYLRSVSSIISRVLNSKGGVFVLLLLNLRVEAVLGLFIPGMLHIVRWWSCCLTKR